MTRPLRITSPANHRLKQVMKLRRGRDRRKTGLFLAEGRREVSRAVAAGLTVRELLTCPELLVEASEGESPASRRERAASELHRLCPALPADVPWLELPAGLLKKLTYHDEPEGVLAVLEQPGWTLARLPTPGSDTLYLVAVGIEKPGNLGAMVRTAAAAGCDAVLAATSAAAPGDVCHPNAIRASTAAVFALPTVVAMPEAILNWLVEAGVRVMAATPTGAVPYTAADWRGPVAIAIGPEDAGLDYGPHKAWLHAADRTGGQRVSIPVHSPVVDSLNASTAAAVLLYAARQAMRGDDASDTLAR